MDIKNYLNELEFFAKKAVPYAQKSATRRMAFEVRKSYIKNIEQTFTLKNKWTLRSVRVQLDKDEARVGSMADYMLEQEVGATKKAKPIPTAYAAGQRGRRTKLVKRRYRLGKRFEKRSKALFEKKSGMMLYSLRQKRVTIKPTHVLKRAVDSNKRHIDDYLQEAALYQLRRRGLR